MKSEDIVVSQRLSWAAPVASRLVSLGLTAEIIFLVVEMLAFLRAEAGEFLTSPVESDLGRG